MADSAGLVHALNPIRGTASPESYIAPDGMVYGIELLNANAQLEAEDNGNLVIINEAIGRRQELPLAVHEEPAKYTTKNKRKT